MFGKPLNELGKEDIQRLIDDEVVESRMLDYKRRLPGNTDKEKVEFLADISSFANAAGGYVVYGLGDRKDLQDKKMPGNRRTLALPT